MNAWSEGHSPAADAPRGHAGDLAIEGDAPETPGALAVDDLGRLIGIVTRSNLLEPSLVDAIKALVVADILECEPVTAYAEESCRSAAEKMAQARVGRLPVVADDNPRQLVGIITRSDLLKPHARSADEEQRRERFFDLRFAPRRKPEPVSTGS